MHCIRQRKSTSREADKSLLYFDTKLQELVKAILRRGITNGAGGKLPPDIQKWEGRQKMGWEKREEERKGKGKEKKQREKERKEKRERKMRLICNPTNLV